MMKRIVKAGMITGIAACAALLIAAQNNSSANAADTSLPAQAEIVKAGNRTMFETVSEQAIAAMRKKAEELHIQGVGVVAYIPGESVEAWVSKMVVVGKLKNNPAQNDPGVNLLAIAYSKAAEMADTLKNSGSGVRAPLKGEFGWQGGLIEKGKTGYLLASFSGGPSEDDLKAARAALDLLAGKL